MNRQLKFGIELEVATSKSRAEIVDALKNAGINVESARYGSQVIENTWKVQPDGSLNNGWEIVSPPLTDVEELKTVVHVLRKELKVRCNKLTGLHIHHDINDFNLNQIKNLYKLYTKYETNALRSIIAKSRIYNSYCQPVKPVLENVLNSETIQEFKNSISSRYHNLNNKAYIKYGTIEFRNHQGTTDLNEILAWIELTHKIIETAQNMKDTKELNSTNNESALEEMLQEVGLENNQFVVKHYKRVQKFIAKRSA